MSNTIIGLLDSALTPFLDLFTFNFDQTIVEAMVPAPEGIPCILKNEPFNVYLFFKEGVDLEHIDTEVTLTCFDSLINNNLTYKVKGK